MFDFGVCDCAVCGFEYADGDGDGVEKFDAVGRDVCGWVVAGERVGCFFNIAHLPLTPSGRGKTILRRKYE